MSKYALYVNGDPCRFYATHTFSSPQDKYSFNHKKSHTSNDLTRLDLAIAVSYISSTQSLGASHRREIKTIVNDCAKIVFSSVPLASTRMPTAHNMTNARDRSTHHRATHNFLKKAITLILPLARVSLSSQSPAQTSIYESCTIAYAPVDYFKQTLSFKLEPVVDDMKSAGLSTIKKEMRLLEIVTSHTQEEMKDKLDLVEQTLLAITPSATSTIELSLSQGYESSMAQFDCKDTCANFHDLTLKTIQKLKFHCAYVISSASQIEKPKSLSVQEFKGIFSKTTDIDKNKSYVYLVKNHKDEVGFLGLSVSPQRAKSQAVANYSLKPVQTFSRALIFHTANYKECGIGELRNRSQYKTIEAVECSQVLRMKDTSFQDDKIQAFASGIQRAQLQEFLDTEVASNAASTPTVLSDPSNLNNLNNLNNVNHLNEGPQPAPKKRNKI